MQRSVSFQHLCCAHRAAASSPPLPPSRPIPSIDGIFALAALPEDHPDAIHMDSPRKPRLDKSIVRSPSVVNKLRQQFAGKKSLGSLKVDGRYDEDAVEMESLPDLDQKMETADVVPEIKGRELMTEAPVQQPITRPVSKAYSAPNLLLTGLEPLTHRRIHTYPPVGDLPALLEARNDDRPPLEPSQTPCVHQSERSACDVHLHRMEISQQLRSWSSLSNQTEAQDTTMEQTTWSFHRRLPSDIGLSSEGKTVPLYHAGQLSSQGKVNDSLGHERNQSAQYSASVYSRPISTESQRVPEWPLSIANELDVNEQHVPDTESTRPMHQQPELSEIGMLPRPQGQNASRVTTESFVDHISTHSQSTSSRLTKKSKFFEGLTPPRKTVKKRRSVFRFLRPTGSIARTRRLLHTVPTLPVHDGSIDDTGLLTVQYDLTDGPSRQRSRAPSLAAPLTAGNDSEDARTEVKESAESHYNYERGLSIAGDDRRKPLMVNLQKLAEIEEEDRRESSGSLLRRTLSRATPLKDDAGPLMSKALAAHQHEKSLLRSPSKCRAISESVETTASASTCGHKRIGTNLDSWTKFSSRDREDRCGSAGWRDAVITKDFTLVDRCSTPGSIAAPDPLTPASKTSTKRSGTSLLRRASTTFGRVSRYYSNIFSSDSFSGKNRRSSVATSGKLEYPELELLPPVLPMQVTQYQKHHHPHLHSEHLHRAKEHVKGHTVETGDDSRIPRRHRQDQRESSPFREGSPFRNFSAEQDLSSVRRYSTAIGPMDGISDDSIPPLLPSTASKAEMYSEMYQTCVERPSTADSAGSAGVASDGELKTGSDVERKFDAVPTLKQTKQRLQEQQPSTEVDSSARIRQYPSVTVIDDRKGHWRSVSFISAKSGKSIVTESTHDLIALMQAREQEEREKLLRL